METKISTFLEKINNIPSDMIQEGDFLIISQQLEEKIITERRKAIINLLREKNPFNEKELSKLFQCDLHKDLVILAHINLIKIKKQDENPEHNIITLNKEIKIINS